MKFTNEGQFEYNLNCSSFDTVKNDNIVLIENGKLKAQGKFEEIVSKI